MDPLRQLHTPVAEVRAQAPVRDEYGETWVVIDGIETKVPNIKAAKALLIEQDAVREKIRADLDASGVRDRTEQVEITLEDGTKTTVEMLPAGDAGANVLQIGHFPDAPGLFENAARVQSEQDKATADSIAAMKKAIARSKKRGPIGAIIDKVNSILRGDRT